MESHIKLGRIFGIRIGLHFSWLLIASLITFSLAAHFQLSHTDWSASLAWTCAVITGILFFATIIAHELAHALVAKSRKLPVRSITLFALGGVAEIEKESPDARSEFWIGISGPITSVLIGALCLSSAALMGWRWAETPQTPVMSVLVWLGYINITLAVFNMIPGFPLDGGRVLRAIIWLITGDADRSTRIAANVGQLVALGFIALGVMRFFGGGGFGSLWIALIGWFLLQAARSSLLQTEVRAELKGVTVGDVMARDCAVVDGHLNLQTLAEEYVLARGQRCFLEMENGEVSGLLTINDLKKVPRARWPFTTVDMVSRPVDQLKTIEPDVPVIEAIEAMEKEQLNQMPVVSGGKVQGIITRNNIVRFLRTRSELKV
jgi:Zn-dependent protease/CBS domain-containing protein